MFDDYLTIGDVVLVKLLKSSPNRDAYLVYLVNREIFAELPKNHALKPYKIGDVFLAGIMNMNGARIMLSQKIPQFEKKILTMELSDFLNQHNLEIKRASIKDNLSKVFVAGNNITYEMLQEVITKRKDQGILREYYGGVKIYLLPWKYDYIEKAIEALRPAPVDKILSIGRYGDEIHVVIPQEYAGLFFGKKGVNLITAQKLIGSNIKIRLIVEGGKDGEQGIN